VDKEILTSVALGIGLSAACGFRVFVPMMVASIAAHLGILPVQVGFQWLAGWPAIICFTSATAVEILAYYIPFIDNLLDGLTTPLAIGAGTFLMTSVLPIDNEMLRWIGGLIVGGGAAATIQGGSVLTRLASSKLTAGIGNHAVATGEHAAAFGTSVMALVAPLVVAALILLLVFFIIMKFGKKLIRRRMK
jgi:hypothetical protein